MNDLPLTQQLNELIQTENAALLAGDFDTISDLLERKETLVQELAESDVNPNELAALQIGMRRNQELFDHALAGIRHVASRLGDLQTIRRSMNTYNAYGHSLTIDAPQKNTLERRA